MTPTSQDPDSSPQMPQDTPADGPQDALPEGWPQDAVEVAVVTGAWGVRGAWRLKPHSADPQALFSSKRWWWRAPEVRPRLGPAPQGVDPLARLAGIGQPLQVIQAREQGDSVVATLRDLEDRDLAQACRGVRIYVPRSSFPSTDEGEYYWVDLIGLEVINRQGVTLGRVTGLMATGPHSVLRIDGAKGAEILVPFVDAYVDEVDRPARIIRVDWDAED